MLHRCTRKSCRARRSLRQHIDKYIRKPRCTVCGGALKPDDWQIKKNRENVCNCDGYWFPHRKGSAPWCIHSKREPTEEEYLERYR